MFGRAPPRDATSQEYWQKNIKGFAGFYDRTSEENLRARPLFSFFYKKCLFPIEKSYMLKRFNIVMEFIGRISRPTLSVTDIGCGSGVYVKQLAQKNGHVYATDFAQASLDLTQQLLSDEEKSKVTLMLHDATTTPIPKCHAAMAIGVLPYIQNLDVFFKNILPYTDTFLVNFLDSENPLNKLRNTVRFLDVRGYHYQSLKEIEAYFTRYGFTVVRVQHLATGFVVESTRTVSIFAGKARA